LYQPGYETRFDLQAFMRRVAGITDTGRMSGLEAIRVNLRLSSAAGGKKQLTADARG